MWTVTTSTYGRLQGTLWKWLDIHALVQHIQHIQDPAMTLTRGPLLHSPSLPQIAKGTGIRSNRGGEGLPLPGECPTWLINEPLKALVALL